MVNIQQVDIAIAAIRQHINESNERIGTLTAEVRRLQGELVAAQTQRDTAMSQVSYHERKGW